MRLIYLKRLFLIFLLALPLTFMGCSSSAAPGTTAPDFLLDDISGKKVSLSEYKGYTVLLDFWATWCPPCRSSIPEFVELQKRYRDRGLVVLGISVDDPRQVNDEYLSSFKDKFKINYPVLRADQKVMKDYFKDNNIAIPTLFIVDKTGKITDKHVGFSPGAVERSLKKIIP